MKLRLSSLFLPLCLSFSFVPSLAYTMPLSSSFSAAGTDVFVLDPEAPVDLEASRLEYNDGTKMVTALGDVMVSQNGSVLKADFITYDTEKNLITAKGNVTMTDAAGMEIKTSAMAVSDNMTTGEADAVHIVFKDKSRLNAEKIEYNEGKKSTLTKADYSPCDLCGEDPLWQIRADKVEKDDEDQTFRYYNAWLDFGGVPVLYTPYLSHPDPAIKRRTGLLMPIFGSDSDLGLQIITPYFITLGDNQDLTLSPRLMSKQGFMLEAAYRGRFEKGALNFTGGITTTDKDRDTRGYFFSNFGYDINRNWRVKGDLNYVSDDTFLRKYDIGEYNVPWLASKIELEGFGKQSYFNLNGMLFEEMRGDVPNDFSPKIAPAMYYSFMGSPTNPYGYFSVDAYAAVITRNGSDVFSLAKSVEKLNTLWGWHLPFTDGIGGTYKLDATLRADGYYIHDYYLESTGKDFSGSKGRLFPQVSLEWRYPLIRSEENSYQVLEPIVSAVYSPKGCNPEEIPNEDSLDFEFDETNLFSPNRFVGYDRVESGSRINYGLQWSIYGNHLGKISAFVGQSYRFDNNNILPPNSGLDSKSSDYVGKLEFALPQHGFFLNYRFRLSRNKLEPQRNEIDFRTDFDWLSLSGYYLNTKEILTEYSTLPKRREVGLYTNVKLNQFWSAGGYWRYDFIGGGKPISWGAALTYEDECFGVKASLDRTYTSDRDYSGGTTFMLIFNLKTLGMVKAL